jgi:hypothetical protein
LARLIDRAYFHHATLSAADAPAEQREAVQGWLDSALLLRTDQEGLRRRMLTAIARRERSDRRADQAISQLELAALGLVERRREDPRYVRLFHPRSLSALVRLPIPEEIKALRALADALEEPGLEPLRGHQATLRASADALEAAHQELEEALASRGLLASRLTLLRMELVRLFQRSHATLTAAHPHDKAEVESFFIALYRGRRKKKAAAAGDDLGAVLGEDDEA